MPREVLNAFCSWSTLSNTQKWLFILIISLCIIILFLIGFVLVILVLDIRIQKCDRIQEMPVKFGQIRDFRTIIYKDIVNDTTTTPDEEFEKIKQFIVSVHYKLPNGKIATYCVGSIVSQKYFMTSSLCVNTHLVQENLYVRAGSIYYNRGGTIHRFSNLMFIPDWRSNTTDYYTYRYIALVKVKQKFSINYNELARVRLPRQQRDRFLPSYKLYTAGWGISISMGVKPKYKKLRLIPAQMYDTSVACRNYLQRYEVLALTMVENILCAGDLKAPSKDQCNLDPGAPLTHLGIINGVSWSGMSCKNYPTIYTKISLYSNWISNTIKKKVV